MLKGLWKIQPYKQFFALIVLLYAKSMYNKTVTKSLKIHIHISIKLPLLSLLSLISFCSTSGLILYQWNMKYLKEISLNTQSCYSTANHFLCQPSLHLQSKCISKPRINHIWQFSEPQPVVISCLFFASTSECWLYFKTFELQRVMEAGGYKRRLKIYCPWSMIHTRSLVWAPVYHCWNLGGNKAC